jgi:hypothetical protein
MCVLTRCIRQNVQRLAGLYCKRELHARFFPSRSSKFDCIRIVGLQSLSYRILKYKIHGEIREQCSGRPRMAAHGLTICLLKFAASRGKPLE